MPLTSANRKRQELTDIQTELKSLFVEWDMMMDDMKKWLHERVLKIEKQIQVIKESL